MLRTKAQREEERQALIWALTALKTVGLQGKESLTAKNLSYGNQRC
jgi:ABC-type branched-subunit amino acid transport system ATPase component